MYAREAAAKAAQRIIHQFSDKRWWWGAVGGVLDGQPHVFVLYMDTLPEEVQGLVQQIIPTDVKVDYVALDYLLHSSI